MTTLVQEAQAAFSPRPVPMLRMSSLVVTQPRSMAGRRGSTLTVSLLVHALVVMVIVVVPLLVTQSLPSPIDGVRAFFAAPPDLAPPPPPPPPAAGPRAVTARPVQPPPVQPEVRFVAPIEIPTEIKPPSMDLGAGGVPGGVEGGVPGGVVGGIVGGLPTIVAPPATTQLPVRVGGQIRVPKLVHSEAPIYPDVARVAHVAAIVILEATVGTDGRVTAVSLLRGSPLFDEAAMTAVRQWRYQPLLLNGTPTPFIVTVTVNFTITPAAS